jgi:DNA-binding NtrC family response regulator
VSQRRILVVDDEEDLRDVLVHQLRAIGAEIDVAENGRVALEMVQSKWYDAILSEINMPEMTGLEFLMTIRDLGFETPFVILTGFGDKAKAVEALRLGAFDFLEKPWEPERLRATMSDAVEYGYRIRNLEQDLDQALTSLINASPEQLEKVRQVQKSLMLMRIQKKMLDKKAA